jgi:hypothetical protein
MNTGVTARNSKAQDSNPRRRLAETSGRLGALSALSLVSILTIGFLASCNLIDGNTTDTIHQTSAGSTSQSADDVMAKLQSIARSVEYTTEVLGEALNELEYRLTSKISNLENLISGVEAKVDKITSDVRNIDEEMPRVIKFHRYQRYIVLQNGTKTYSSSRSFDPAHISLTIQTTDMGAGDSVVVKILNQGNDPDANVNFVFVSAYPAITSNGITTYEFDADSFDVVATGTLRVMIAYTTMTSTSE